MDTTTTCPTGTRCLACRSTEGLRPVLASTPSGRLCWTACPSCAGGGVVLRLTADAARRMVLGHREHGAR